MFARAVFSLASFSGPVQPDHGDEPRLEVGQLVNEGNDRLELSICVRGSNTVVLVRQKNGERVSESFNSNYEDPNQEEPHVVHRGFSASVYG